MEQLGNIELTLNCSGLKIPYSFTVLRGLSFKIICGVDFLRDCRVVLNCAKNFIMIYEDLVRVPLCAKVDSLSAVRLQHSITIPPQCEVLTSVFVNNAYCNVVSLIEAAPYLHRKMVSVAASVVFPRAGKTVCRLINLCHRPRRFRAGTIVASIEQLDARDKFNAQSLQGDSIKAHSVCASVTSVTLPPHSQRLAILKEVGLSLNNDHLTADQQEQLSALLFRYRELFVSDITKLPCSKLEPYRIELKSNTPIRRSQFKLPYWSEKELERQMDQMKQANIVQPSTSPWNFSTFLVKKAGNTFRAVTDYRPLNKLLKDLFFPLPNIESTMRDVSVERPQYFTLMDLKSGFHQIALALESRQYTAFSTGREHLEYTRLPFGLSISPSIFCFRLSQLLQSELNHRLKIYVDDFLLHSHEFTTHINELERIFIKFRDNDLRFNPTKCSFALKSIDYMGFTLTSQGVQIAKSRFAALESFPIPQTLKQVRSLIGLYTYFKKYIAGFVHIIAPIRELLVKSDKPFKWLPVHTDALNVLKQAVLKHTTLIYPDINKPFIIYVDASRTAVGHALAQQTEDGSVKYVAFGGRALQRSEKHLSATFLELTGLISAIHAYYQFIANGKKLIIRSDHITLRFLKDLKQGPSKLLRFSLLLQQYNFEVQYLPGKHHTLCDALSRREYEQSSQEDIPELELKVHEYLNLPSIEGWMKDTDQVTVATQTDLGINVITPCVDTVCKATPAFVTVAPACSLSVSNPAREIINEEAQTPVKVVIESQLPVLQASMYTPSYSYDVAGRPDEAHRLDDVIIHSISTDVNADEDDNFLQHIEVEDLDFTRRYKRKKYKKSAIAFAPVVTRSRARQNLSATGDVAQVDSDSRATTVPPTDSTDVGTDSTAIQDPLSREDETNMRYAEGEISRHVTPYITLEEQRLDSFFNDVINFQQTGALPLNKDRARQILFQETDFYIKDGLLWHFGLVRNKRLRPLVKRHVQLCLPAKYRLSVLEAYHSNLHIGELRCLWTIRQRYFWKNMARDIQIFVKTCDTCIRIKSRPAVRYGLRNLEPGELHTKTEIDHHDMTRISSNGHSYKYSQKGLAKICHNR